MLKSRNYLLRTSATPYIDRTGWLPLLLREGAKASHVTRVVAEVNDRLTVKILQ